MPHLGQGNKPDVSALPLELLPLERAVAMDANMKV